MENKTVCINLHIKGEYSARSATVLFCLCQNNNKKGNEK